MTQIPRYANTLFTMWPGIIPKLFNRDLLTLLNACFDPVHKNGM
jgi:hypothetical protein